MRGLADMCAKVVGGGLQEGRWLSYISLIFERGWLKQNSVQVNEGGLHEGIRHVHVHVHYVSMYITCTRTYMYIMIGLKNDYGIHVSTCIFTLFLLNGSKNKNEIKITFFTVFPLTLNPEQ